MLDNQPYYYTAADVLRYLSGSMSPEDMHYMEKAALNDPLLADAIEGYGNANTTITNTHLNEINALLQNRQKITATQVVRITKPSKQYGRLMVAAACMVLLAGAAWWVLSLPNTKNNTIAAIAPAPSSADSGKPAHTVAPEAIAEKILHNTPKGGNSTRVKTEKATLSPTPNTADSNAALRSAPGALSFNSKEAARTDEMNNVAAAAPISETLSNEVAGVDISNTPKSKKEVIAEATIVLQKSVAAKTLPYPVGGWPLFYEKLNKALHNNPEKALHTLQLRFTLSGGKPDQFIIVKTPDSVVAKKAIQFIQKETEWKHDETTPQATVTLRVE